MVRRLGMTVVLAAALAAPVFAGSAMADDGAQVVKAEARQSGGTWRFDVTVLHNDTGWEDYADKWDVMTPDGEILGTRVLLHPHETEQPFTRSLSGVTIPDGLTRVVIRAHDNVNGYSGNEYVLELPGPS